MKFSKIFLLLCGFFIADAHAQRPLAITSFISFLKADCHISLPKDTAYYMAVSPSMCASCNLYYISMLSKFSSKKRLYIICDSLKKESIASGNYNKNTRYITDFNYEKLGKQFFMKSGIAFGTVANNDVIAVDIINKQSIPRYKK